MGNDIPCKSKPKMAEIAVFISDNIEFKHITVIRDKGHDIIIKESIYQEHIIKYKYVCTQHQSN